ncbi:hypothetical protein GTO89_12510 [Heliobacterium gestii]|uniref:Methyl-accepting chemotaxis protein n=1 Tax=Heliomicrobium gestii TaxID=2699 RepID=A0A845LGZ4_HELGE|nr:hypothetical protein [Heliomicrobium gestii]MBM7867305.1 methyl-accepting chemotaxis protein [Heliomicrobium gestii]MZP43859.1 hypothetical protein [Heliomicrobium gestii]
MGNWRFILTFLSVIFYPSLDYQDDVSFLCRKFEKAVKYPRDQNSESSVKEIEEILRVINQSMRRIEEKINQTAELGDRQAAATEVISASMQSLAESAVEIEKVAEIL